MYKKYKKKLCNVTMFAGHYPSLQIRALGNTKNPHGKKIRTTLL
jgi:hypothetical protein